MILAITFIPQIPLVFHFFCPQSALKEARKFKLALNPTYKIFSNFAKRCVLLCLSNVDNIKQFHHTVFELEAHKAVIKGVFSK